MTPYHGMRLKRSPVSVGNLGGGMSSEARTSSLTPVSGWGEGGLFRVFLTEACTTE